MKNKVLFLLLLLGAMSANAQTLKFNANGKFKIVQFTDVHYIADDPRSVVALERINEVLDSEQPDLVIFTGDVIYGKPAEKSLRTVLAPVAERKLPFAVTFGNHDDEQGLTRQELLNIIQSVPGNLTTRTEGLSGVTNFILPVRSSDGSKDAEALYLFDSHSYSRIKGIGGYDYIKFDQIQWYKERSQAFAAANGGAPLPSLAFFHIALPEFHQAVADESAPLFGIRKEKACSPALNSGLYVAMKEMGDVEGVFVGHDHDNDYAVMWHGILLAYGRYTGGDTVYNNLPNGARVIELTENEPGFRTWISLKGGQTEQVVKYPESFLRPRK